MQQDVAEATALGDDVMKKIVGTSLDKPSEITALPVPHKRPTHRRARTQRRPASRKSGLLHFALPSDDFPTLVFLPKRSAACDKVRHPFFMSRHTPI